MTERQFTHDDFYHCFALLADKKEAKDFLFDLCTEQELSSMKERLQVAILLEEGRTYRDISKVTGSSTTTITRVAKFLNKSQNSGYRQVLRKREKN